MILSAIVAISKNRAIGLKNKLPWHVPEDLQFFREKTKNKVMIMGRKTFESMPSPSKLRFHIVITRNPNYRVDHPNVEVVSSLREAIELSHLILKKNPEKFGQEVFITGGAEIYAQSFDLLHKYYLTVIDQVVEGDAFLPEFDLSKMKLTEERPFNGGTFYTYEANEDGIQNLRAVKTDPN